MTKISLLLQIFIILKVLRPQNATPKSRLPLGAEKFGRKAVCKLKTGSLKISCAQTNSLRRLASADHLPIQYRPIFTISTDIVIVSDKNSYYNPHRISMKLNGLLLVDFYNLHIQVER